MLKSEVQHHYWITKKVVQRKLGTKEDEHVISSDADLDAKIEVFKSIAETSGELCKIINQYQEQICILSQEECVFGRFLREVGKRSKTTGQTVTNTGKAMSFAGQQRMSVRVPLLRLQHEVDVFRYRAVKDTEITLQAMEKERTEYRAALSWMKSASTELDPDTGKGLDKFRTAQSHVRAAKHNFDSFSLNSIQKIDLLAAARCNMYSLVLVAYMEEMRIFAQKAASTFDTISKSLIIKPRYDFCVLKELTQNEGEKSTRQEIVKPIETVDKDQSLFFASDYEDKPADVPKLEAGEATSKNIEDESETPCETESESLLIQLSMQLEDITCPLIIDEPELNEETAGITNDSNKFWSKMFSSNQQQSTTGLIAQKTTDSKVTKKLSLTNNQQQQAKTTTKSANPWMDLFADLDPLANPDAFDLKLSGGRSNAQQT